METKNWLLLLTVPLLFAGPKDSPGPGAFTDITQVLSGIQDGLKSILDVAVYVGIILAAALYGISQLVPDPQERAKFQAWAWGAVLGAIGALLINVIGGWIIDQLSK